MAQFPSSANASDVWSLKDQRLAIKGANWPGLTTRSFSISPAVSGKSTWNLDTDGALDLGSQGTWTITPIGGALSTSIKMWGAGGGSTARGYGGAGGGGGSSTGLAILPNGSSFVIRVGRVVLAETPINSHTEISHTAGNEVLGYNPRTCP